MTIKSILGKICLMAMILSMPHFVNAQGAPATTRAARPAPGPRVPPVALRPDIQVEHVMKTGPKGFRLALHEATGDLWYIAINGDVYKIKNVGSANPTNTKVFTAADHGIKNLQGLTIYKNTMFLCGNYTTENGLNNHGRAVRYDITNPDKPVMSVVFTTDSYPTNISFDHGWNAVKVSPDGKYLYVNSGSRTDHGEVEDKGGLFPNARIGAFTARIFRFPVNTKDLVLPNDEAKLKAEGYVYAEGFRNAFDLNYDGQGNLFAVSNSPDYDMTDDMFWVRQGHHYGFPWIAGGIEMPQQYADYQPSPDTDPFIPRSGNAWVRKAFSNDPDYPKPPEGVKFSPGVQNLGPDANEYRGHSGKVLDGDLTGVTISGFTPHTCPIGLVFDTKNILAPEFKGDGFVLRYSKGGMMGAFTKEGGDLLHLDMAYNKLADNYYMKVTRIADGFKNPTGAFMIKNVLYVIENGDNSGGDLWKVTLPVTAAKAAAAKK
jgi:glucose/arabinose dehydrogenase